MIRTAKFKLSGLMIFGLIMSSSFVICAEPEATKEESVQEEGVITSEMLNATLYSKIAQAHLPSLMAGTVENIFTDKEKKDEKVVLDFNIKPLSKGDENTFAFKLFANYEAKTKSTPASFVDPVVWKDLELFCGLGKKEQHLFGKLNRTVTTAGKLKLAQMLVTVNSDIPTLKNRQEILKGFLADKKLVEEVDNALSFVAEAEPTFYQFYKELDTMGKMLLELQYFNGGKSNPLNKSDGLLDLCYGVQKTGFVVYGTAFMASPVFMGLMAYQNFMHNQPAEGIKYTIYSLGTAWMLKTLCEQIKPQLIDFPNKLQQQLISARTILDSCNQITEAFESCPELRQRIPALTKIEEFMEGVGFDGEELDALIKLLKTRTFKGDPSFFSRYGRVLRAFSLMGDMKYEFGSALEALGEVDAYLSMIKLMQEYQESKNHLGDKIKYSFVTFAETDRPYCKLTNFWCPLIDVATVVPANFELGGSGNAGDVVLTGPNTGGKSIAIKGLLINLMLAQTFGIAPAEDVVMTPFSKIYTHMNIVDNPEAGESRFMAEALRAISIFDMVASCKDHEFCFIIIDEMFSGTEPIPGEECAFAFAEELARHKNSMSVIATHYRYLTTLPQHTNGAFKNYKVSVNKLQDGGLEFPYKLATGIADTNIALDILRLKLKQRGYETAFLNNAQKRVDERRKA